MRVVENAIAIQPTQLAIRPVNAHQLLDQFQLGKRIVDASLGLLLIAMKRCD